MADKDDRLGVVEPDTSLAGTESGSHDVPWQIRMIIWECSKPMLACPTKRVDLQEQFSVSRILGVFVLDASLTGTESGPDRCCFVTGKGHLLEGNAQDASLIRGE